MVRGATTCIIALWACTLAQQLAHGLVQAVQARLHERVLNAALDPVRQREVQHSPYEPRNQQRVEHDDGHAYRQHALHHRHAWQHRHSSTDMASGRLFNPQVQATRMQHDRNMCTTAGTAAACFCHGRHALVQLASIPPTHTRAGSDAVLLFVLFVQHAASQEHSGV